MLRFCNLEDNLLAESCRSQRDESYENTMVLSTRYCIDLTTMRLFTRPSWIEIIVLMIV